MATLGFACMRRGSKKRTLPSFLSSICWSGEAQTYNKLHLPTSRCRYEAGNRRWQAGSQAAGESGSQI